MHFLAPEVFGALDDFMKMFTDEDGTLKPERLEKARGWDLHPIPRIRRLRRPYSVYIRTANFVFGAHRGSNHWVPPPLQVAGRYMLRRLKKNVLGHLPKRKEIYVPVRAPPKP